MPNDCLVAFGSNVGDSDGCFTQICSMWKSDPRFDDLVASELITTRPVGSSKDQNRYRNGCIRFRFADSLDDLFHELIKVEHEFGRQRRERWGARTVDLDLLLFGNASSDSPKLKVPHPRMTFRRFVLQPACEIAADMVNPVSGLTMLQHFELLDSRPNTIAFVASQSADFEAAIGEKLVALRESGWQFEFVSELEQIQTRQDQIKLLVYSLGLPRESIVWAKSFPAATLAAVSDAEELDEVELAAAIEAMGPL